MNLDAVHEARRLIQEHGLSANQAAQQAGDPLGVSGRTIQRWAANAGLPLGPLTHDTAKQAREHQAEQYEARRARLKLILLDKVEEVLGAGWGKSSDARQFSIAVGVLIDKLRLEEGKATGRTESSVEMVDQAARMLREFVEQAEEHANSG